VNILKSLQAPNSVQPALISSRGIMSYEDVHLSVQSFADILKRFKSECVALYLDNCSQWVIADLAAHLCNIPIVPLPTFFSQAQLSHMIEDVGADILITHCQLNQQPLLSLFQEQPIEQDDNGFVIYRKVTHKKVSYPSGLAKITYTSGSTGTPKGVCLNVSAQLAVANSLNAVLKPLEIEKHLCVLPLSTLLENIAGVWAPLSIGASVAIPSLVELGFGGASDLDPQKFLSTVAKYDPESIILVPELLNVMVSGYEAGFHKPSKLKFIAVGGAKVSSSLLKRAHALGLPVYEGYGLSEACSVTTLNKPSHNKAGTSGQVLPHVKIRISSDNEIEVSGSNMLGYLHEDKKMPEFYPTGDLGEIDNEGFVTIHGRKKNLFITSYGRQVNPEWVEEALCKNEKIFQAVVYGESLPFNIAVIVLSDSSIETKDINECIERSNKLLPDYAKVSCYIIADAAFSFQDDTLTSNGRIKRTKVYETYSNQIQALTESYSSKTASV
jgi:long-chain acyl-CoA synthetase